MGFTRQRAALLAAVAVLLPCATASAAIAPSIAEIQASLGSGATTCRAVVGDALARMQAAEVAGSPNAVLEVNPAAFAIADRRDAAQAGGGPLGPLHCVPVLIKDNHETADRLTTTVGSLAMRGYRAPRDAFVVARLRKAGAVVVGKTNMDEWAHGASGYSSRGGQTQNGLNPSRGPGGSSGGSAAAVAAGLVPLAAGSDTGGSIQIPASYNGIVGLRPTIGLISRAGIVPYASQTDAPGPLVGSVADLGRVLGTMTGVDPADPATRASRGHFLSDYTPFLDPNGLRGARIGVLRRAFKTAVGPASPDTELAFEQALGAMRALGATVVDDLPELRGRKAGWPIVFKVVGRQFRPELDAWFETGGRRAPVDSLADVIARSSRPKLRPRVRILKSLKAEQAAGPEGPGYRRAARRASDLGEATRDYLRRHDLDALVYPATGCPAPPLPGVVDQSYRCEGAEQPLDFGDNPGTIAPMLSPATGLPVLTLPGPAMPGDQRVGLSLLGPRWSEGALIRMSYGFELGLAGQ